LRSTLRRTVQRISIFNSVYELPAWFTRLAYRIRIVLGREPIAAPATSALTTAATTTTVSATATVVSTAKSSRSTWGSTFASGARFIHFQLPPARFFAVESGDRLRGLLIVRHLHKRESTRPAGFPIHRHVDACHLPERLE
jgi:hypothetical protein